MKLLILSLIIGLTNLANAETKLSCVASNLHHQTLSVVEDSQGLVRLQKYFEGNLLGEELIARHFNENSSTDFILVGKGGEKEYLKLAPGALNPKYSSKKTHVVLSPTEVIDPTTAILYNCLRQ